MAIEKKAVRNSLKRLICFRHEFTWEPGLLEKYSRIACHKDIRGCVAILRILEGNNRRESLKLENNNDD